jgi:antitoxin ParD1/3/4
VVVNIVLRQDQQDFIQACLVSGRYTSVDDVLHEAIELLMQQDEQFEKLRTAIDLGTQDIRAGRVVDGEAVFEEIQARIEQIRLEQHG